MFDSKLHSFKCGVLVEDTKTKLDKYYVDSALSILLPKKWFLNYVATVQAWSRRDEKHSGCPVDVAKLKIVEKIHDKMLAEQRVEVWEIMEAIGISWFSGKMIAAFAYNRSQTQLFEN